MIKKRKCLKLYPGCSDCPYLGKNKNKTRCPYYLGIDNFTAEQHHEHETIGQRFQQLKKKEDRFYNILLNEK